MIDKEGDTRPIDIHNRKDAKTQRLKNRKIQLPKEHIECSGKIFLMTIFFASSRRCG